MNIQLGQKGTFSKTIFECDVCGFAGITGGFYSAHVNNQVAIENLFEKK